MRGHNVCFNGKICKIIPVTPLIWSIQKLFFICLNENIHCDYSLELSRGDGSNEGSQCMFLLKNMQNYPKIIPVSPLI